MMKDQFEANVSNNDYMGNDNWVEESYIEPLNGSYFKDIIKKYEGKKVKITIEEMD